MNEPKRPVSKAEALHRQAIEILAAGRVDEGISVLKQALTAASASPTARSIILNDMAMAYWEKGRPELAEKNYARAVQLCPQNARAIGNYGAFLIEQDRLPEAEPLLMQALKLMPDHYKIQNDVGRLYYKKGNLAAAEKFYLESIRLNPSWVNARSNLGELLTDTGRLESAEKEFLEVLRTSPKNAQALNGLAKVYLRMKRDDEASDYLDKALAAGPFLETAWSRKLNLLERTQRLDEAAAALVQAKQACPESPRITIIEAKLLRRQGKIAEALALLEQKRTQLKIDERMARSAAWDFLFELGELYDRTGNTDKAFDCFSRANAAEAKSTKARLYDKGELLAKITLLRAHFTPGLAQKPGPVDTGDGRRTPVFLIGFPRSGTTLLDQVLSSHPGIRVADEKPVIDKLDLRLRELYAGSYPAPAGATSRSPAHLAALADFKSSDIAELRRIYFAEHGSTAEWQGLFVDKLPLNILQVGLIHRVFPDARFILALRHPCDCVLSCFMQRFELNPAMVQFLNLEDGARFYDAVFGLWDHFTSTMPLKFHAIRYEDVVSDFRPSVSALLDFLGAEWNDAVLEFDKTAREKARISTPSYHQVTQKLYTRASGRWQRYREHLKTIIPILEPQAEKYGYSMEPAAP